MTTSRGLRADQKYNREHVQRRHDTFRRTGHFPECAGYGGCDDSGCAAARFVSRWEAPCAR